MENKSTAVNLTEELADLLTFASSTSLAIRMSIASKDPERDKDILWLSDTFSQLELLTTAIKEGNLELINKTSLELENGLLEYLHPFRYSGVSSQPKKVFDKWSEIVDHYQIVGIFRRIGVKVSSHSGLTCINCHRVYWPSEVEYAAPPDCEWRKTQNDHMYYLCPWCCSWTEERRVDLNKNT